MPICFYFFNHCYTWREYLWFIWDICSAFTQFKRSIILTIKQPSTSSNHMHIAKLAVIAIKVWWNVSYSCGSFIESISINRFSNRQYLKYEYWIYWFFLRSRRNAWSGHYKVEQVLRVLSEIKHWNMALHVAKK